MPTTAALYSAFAFHPRTLTISVESCEEKAPSGKPTTKNTIITWLQGVADGIAASLPRSKGEQKKQEELEQAKSDSEK